MTLYEFNQSSYEKQLQLIFLHGVFVANRRENYRGVNLYHCADEGRGFFVEVSYDRDQQKAVILRSCSSSVLLEDYAHRVRLPEGW